ncbi:hypothetical protein PAGA_a0490 [Pseudoalteromonas agarivorans DSM 14585]|uniref:Uncharacterized protein n=1 Tax=Pseudoalteromonas agarivorans DSM 14585 TaxID=1312369 RepID=A0ACA8DSH1_9GAMM|nr:hypothetical protein PAGA_a0490 [Pseudoalteromonas agarivorans DSM 14585]
MPLNAGNKLIRNYQYSLTLANYTFSKKANYLSLKTEHNYALFLSK